MSSCCCATAVIFTFYCLELLIKNDSVWSKVRYGDWLIVYVAPHIKSIPLTHIYRFRTFGSACTTVSINLIKSGIFSVWKVFCVHNRPHRFFSISSCLIFSLSLCHFCLCFMLVCSPSLISYARCLCLSIHPLHSFNLSILYISTSLSTSFISFANAMTLTVTHAHIRQPEL